MNWSLTPPPPQDRVWWLEFSIKSLYKNLQLLGKRSETQTFVTHRFTCRSLDSPSSRKTHAAFRNRLSHCDFSAHSSIPKLEDHPLSAVRNCFSIRSQLTSISARCFRRLLPCQLIHRACCSVVWKATFCPKGRTYQRMFETSKTIEDVVIYLMTLSSSDYRPTASNKMAINEWWNVSSRGLI
jgi:hypothetical protein